MHRSGERLVADVDRLVFYVPYMSKGVQAQPGVCVYAAVCIVHVARVLVCLNSQDNSVALCCHAREFAVYPRTKVQRELLPC